jgi:hypothetical protein
MLKRGMAVVFLAAMVFSGACTPQAQRIEAHREVFESLGATAALIVQAWLAGDVSGTYARTSLETTFKLIEQERATLASKPQTVADPGGAILSQLSERLSRLVAQLAQDVTAADGRAARAHLSQIPIQPAELR